MKRTHLPRRRKGALALLLALLLLLPLPAFAAEEIAPHKVCAYIYALANAFNHFYHETKILAEEDLTRRAGYIRLLELCRGIMEICIDVLGFEAPERM